MHSANDPVRLSITRRKFLGSSALWAAALPAVRSLNGASVAGDLTAALERRFFTCIWPRVGSTVPFSCPIIHSPISGSLNRAGPGATSAPRIAGAQRASLIIPGVGSRKTLQVNHDRDNSVLDFDQYEPAISSTRMGLFLHRHYLLRHLLASGDCSQIRSHLPSMRSARESGPGYTSERKCSERRLETGFYCRLLADGLVGRSRKPKLDMIDRVRI
jgi:hypothetical protein